VDEDEEKSEQITLVVASDLPPLEMTERESLDQFAVEQKQIHFTF